jgi:hypothetical protein
MTRNDRTPPIVVGVPREVEQASLAVLHDLGLSDGQIANYFAVDPAAVSQRRDRLGVIDPS